MTDPTDPFDRKLLAARRDRASSTLAEADFLMARASEEFAERLAATNRQFNTALDLGCHTGLIARSTLRQIDCVISMDLSQAMARQAPSPQLAGSEEYLPFAHGSLDLVTSALSLHWVNDLPGTLLQIRQALKPDGLFLGAMLGGATLHELREAMMQAEAECEGGVSPRVSPFADLKDMGGLLQRAGFALPVADADLVTVRYDSAFHLFRDLKAMGETNVLAARRKQPIKRSTLIRAAEIYQEKFSRSDGRLSASFEILYLTGWAPHENQQKPMRPGTAKMRLADALNPTPTAPTKK